MELKIIPRMSEKTYVLSTGQVYTFNVPMRANKAQIAQAVAKQFDVKVIDVNTTVVKGKVKRSYRKGGSPVVGVRANVKKVYVRLAEGHSIPAFAEIAAQAAQSTNEEKK